jgi:hypothetical protein
MKLSSKAVIATLNVGAWRTVKRHAAETRAENARHGLTDQARVDVEICTHPALEAIASLHAEARAEHYRLSLPAADKGLRLLAGARQYEHSQLMQSFATRIEQLVAAFLNDYDRLRAEAPARLNGLYIASQWPTHDVVKSKFSFATRYLPVPDQGQWAEWFAEAATEAQAELLERLRDAITKVATKLADPKAIFRDSLVGNLTDLLALVPDLNLNDDPTIAALAAKAKGLVEFDADTLREDPIARATVADRAGDLCSLFNLS